MLQEQPHLPLSPPENGEEEPQTSLIVVFTAEETQEIHNILYHASQDAEDVVRNIRVKISLRKRSRMLQALRLWRQTLSSFHREDDLGR